MEYTTQDCFIQFKPKTKLIQTISSKVHRCFQSLEELAYLTPIDRKDFYWFRCIYQDALEHIDTRLETGSLTPLDLYNFPTKCCFPYSTCNAAIFTGSFDPFQMTHLAFILKFLAHDQSNTGTVFVIPEGAHNPLKPHRSNYEYRYKLMSLQLKNIFYPLIYPLDIGKDADTITIWKRFIELIPCRVFKLTHLIGTDVLPYAIKMLPEDLAIWNEEAQKKQAEFTYRAYILQRNESYEDIRPLLKQLDAMQIAYQFDDKPLRSPSSTDFRSNNVFSIVFPTKEMLSHMEIVFRYGLHRSWTER